jgi:hypothetical protein
MLPNRHFGSANDETLVVFGASTWCDWRIIDLQPDADRQVSLLYQAEPVVVLELGE